MALFQDHGAISLNFELRVDVLINRVLNEEGIDIPFPQWDFYLHDVPIGA